MAKSIYDFTVADIDGNNVGLSVYKGAPSLIVNFSTKDPSCEKAFSMLAQLRDKYNIADCRKDLNILLFPCYQFGAKESVRELVEFFERNGDVGDVFAEIDVNGPKSHELYKFLKQTKPGNCGGFITSNFTMFLVDKNGIPVERFTSTMHPNFVEDIIDKMLRKEG
ncbi:uncharacterized protein LOC129758232 [Uranotaenia lowii]|uniref:uncharacterized protein LOC129758232 n=1 Tax=Uranotaenia lowii TaxID=190385 RepID=UPI00247964A9|nr:uncharacterized protein LOC129758232 [Uranotaenia lowii]